jgi:hypothetical protein
MKHQFVVTHTVCQNIVPTRKKMLNQSMFELYNMLKFVCQAFSVPYKTLYWWVTTSRCFLSDIGHMTRVVCSVQLS